MACELKPSIPLVGEHGIPVHDELDLCRVLDPHAQGVAAVPPWGEVHSDRVAMAREGYAEELRFTGRIRGAAVVKAFATVPREHFLGPGPVARSEPDEPGRVLENWVDTTSASSRPH
jgi:hypothetical protein